jgi:signal transduction histidine kinase
VGLSQRNVLRIVAVGFSLLVLLVLGAAYVGYESSKTIQRNAQQMVRERLVGEGRAAELEAAIELESELLLNKLEWILALCFLLAAGCSGLAIWFITRTLRRLEWQTDELNRVSWQMIEDQERIARRFSHEMHDEFGQALTGLKSLAKRWSGAEFESGRGDFVHTIDDVLRGVRELSQLLRPVILDDFGLDAGLRWLCSRFSERTQIEIEYVSNFEGRLSEQLETHFFRITQEALTNIARHSGASQAWVRLARRDDRMELEIEDNGRGMVQPDWQERPSLGMVGMRARARHIQGVLQVSSLPGGGVRIRVTAPARVQEDAEELSTR